MRSLTTFVCEGATLAATLDLAAGTTGLLIVSGGTQTRVGAARNMARLAQTLATAGAPVFRYDRRGVGASEGEDPGFADSGADLAAAAAAFRARCPHLQRIVGFGLCDGATALALHHHRSRIDALILANPWVVEPASDLPPPAAIRRRYADRLKSPKEWARLLTGGVDYRKAIRGLAAIARRPAAEGGLAQRVAVELIAGERPLQLILAEGDATAQAFTDAWEGKGFAKLRRSAALTRIPTPSHGFTRGDDPARLAEACLAALAEFDGLSAKAA